MNLQGSDMLALLCLLQVSAAISAVQAPDRQPETPSVIALSSARHFESMAAPAFPTTPSPTLEISPFGSRAGLGSATLLVSDTTRRVAIEYSDWYYTRLTIHKYASYATIPLFALQYASGQDLIKHGGEGSWGRDVHGPAAASIAVLFGVNTVTGLWNLYDSRKDPNGRTRRTVHSLLMLAADAGFVWTGALAPDDDEGGSSGGAGRHRTVAITSGSIALAGYLMMLIWKD